MDINALTLGEIKEIARLTSCKSDPQLPDPRGATRIVILQRGWVVVGKVTLDGAEYVIKDARVIRNWGTTKGLGEIAKNGPTDKTVLDPSNTVRCHSLAVVAQIDCEECKWK